MECRYVQPMSVYPRGQFFQHRIKDYWLRARRVIVRTTGDQNVDELLEDHRRMLDCMCVEIVEKGPREHQLDIAQFAARSEDAKAPADVTGLTKSPPINILSFSVVNEELEQSLLQDVRHLQQRSCDIVYVEVKCNAISTETETIRNTVCRVISAAFHDLDIEHQLVVEVVKNQHDTTTTTSTLALPTADSLSQIPQQRTNVFKRPGASETPSPTKVKRLSLSDNDGMTYSGQATELYNIQPQHHHHHQQQQRQQPYTTSLESDKHKVPTYNLGQAISYQIEDRLFRVLETVETKLRESESANVKRVAVEGQISTVDKMLFELGGLYNQGKTRLCLQKQGELKPKLDQAFKIKVLDLNENVVCCGRLYGRITVLIKDIPETELTTLRESVTNCLKQYNLDKETFVIQGMQSKMQMLCC